MADDDYELLPREELEYLRREIERLKRNPLGDTQSSITLLESLNKLDGNVSQLVKVLESANDEMVKTFQDNSVQEQLRKLREENAKIAHGIVALADLVKEVKSKQESAPPQAARPAEVDEPTFNFSGEDVNQDMARQNPFLPQPNIESSSFIEEPTPPLPPRRIPLR